MKNSIFLFAFVCFMLFSCKPKNDIGNTSDDLKRLVNEWNDAHAKKDVAIFSALYSDTISFYGQKIPKNKCIDSKLVFLEKYPDFSQKIIGIDTVAIQAEDIYKCNFVKKVTIADKTTDYPSYLIFKKKNDQWFIIAESDQITDDNLAKKQTQSQEEAPNKIKGDFDGDGTDEYMWLVVPKVEEIDLDIDYTSYIVFSNPKIPKIKIPSCIDGILSNLGDLNDDGKDEIGILSDWYTGCWRDYFVWTLKDGNWIQAVDPISIYTACGNENDYFFYENNRFTAIKKDKEHKGYVIIKYSDVDHENDDNFVNKTKSVKIK